MDGVFTSLRKILKSMETWLPLFWWWHMVTACSLILFSDPYTSIILGSPKFVSNMFSFTCNLANHLDYHLVTYPLFLASIIFTYKSRYLRRGQLGPSWRIQLTYQLSPATDLSTSIYQLSPLASQHYLSTYIYIYISTYINKTRTSWPINLPINYNPHLTNSHFDPGAQKQQAAHLSLRNLMQLPRVFPGGSSVEFCLEMENGKMMVITGQKMVVSWCFSRDSMGVPKSWRFLFNSWMVYNGYNGQIPI